MYTLMFHQIYLSEWMMNKSFNLNINPKLIEKS